MELFKLLNIMFEKPLEYSKVTVGEKRRHFFMITRRLAINFPLQAQVLQRIKINEVAVVDFWQKFLRKQYNKTPYWMYTKGIKKAKEKKEKVTNIKESSIKDFSTCMGYDIKTVKEALEFFPDEMKRELHEFEKMIL